MFTKLCSRVQNRSKAIATSYRHLAVQAIASNPPGLCADELLGDEHKARVVTCMQSAPPVGLRMQKTAKENIYAAVLIALCTSKTAPQEVSILYTRRSGSLSRHVRQVSFPGGLQDHADTDHIDCALRETEEEIGLPRSRIEIWGIGSLIRPPMTAAIMPVLGVVRDFDLNELKLNEDEVEEAFTVPLSAFLKPGVLRHTQFKSGFSSPVFLVERNKIWGITGFLTNNYLHCLIPELYKGRVPYLKPYKTEKPKFQHTND